MPAGALKGMAPGYLSGGHRCAHATMGRLRPAPLGTPTVLGPGALAANALMEGQLCQGPGARSASPSSKLGGRLMLLQKAPAAQPHNPLWQGLWAG